VDVAALRSGGGVFCAARTNPGMSVWVKPGNPLPYRNVRSTHTT
jgi:hypothetical protein